MAVNLSIGPFGPNVTSADLAAFFVANGVVATGIVISGHCSARIATAETAEPGVAILACDSKILRGRSVRVVEI